MRKNKLMSLLLVLVMLLGTCESVMAGELGAEELETGEIVKEQETEVPYASETTTEPETKETEAIHYMQPYYCSNVTLFQGNPKKSFSMMGREYTWGLQIENSTWGVSKGGF